MTPEQFVYWLQGFIELNGCSPTEEQWQSIKDHLATVFKKVTPSMIGQIPYHVPSQLGTGTPELDWLKTRITC